MLTILYWAAFISNPQYVYPGYVCLWAAEWTCLPELLKETAVLPETLTLRDNQVSIHYSRPSPCPTFCRSQPPGLPIPTRPIINISCCLTPYKHSNVRITEVANLNSGLLHQLSVSSLKRKSSCHSIALISTGLRLDYCLVSSSGKMVPIPPHLPLSRLSLSFRIS